jgi:hypothetical protein
MDLNFSDDLFTNLLHFSNLDTGAFVYRISENERFKELPPKQNVEQEIDLVEDVEDGYGPNHSASSATAELQTDVSPEPPIQVPILRRYVSPVIN